jgi:hypothetical protein
MKRLERLRNSEQSICCIAYMANVSAFIHFVHLSVKVDNTNNHSMKRDFTQWKNSKRKLFMLLKLLEEEARITLFLNT